MTDRDRHRRASEIFLQACELPPDEQSAFIAHACGEDAALRHEVESLLEHDRQAAEAGATRQFEEAVGRAAEELGGEDQAPPGVELNPGQDPADQGMSRSQGLEGTQDGTATPLPERIGRYRIVRLVARGGMGEVYEAEQSTPVRRRVALKVIRAGLDSAEVLARFMAERQALALMSHPHIAAIHDAGATREGRPYVVMEYVDGEPVTDYAERHRLDLGARLDLFLGICEAVSHAHQKGVIHRDLKPSNILVTRSDGRAVPKVIDFGIAKATQQPLTERTLETSLGQLVGTPEYMSPEQAAGTGLDVDTRADVYALGAILYELLAGVNPLPREALKKAGLEEMLRLIREHEPVRPSLRVSTLSRRLPELSRPEGDTLARKLAGDLDWITLRALEKDRERRYGSVADLAGDLRRYRRHEPVTAGPPSRVYRMRKFVQRNRTGVAFGVLLSAVLVASGVAVTWQWRTAVAERERAEAAGEHARQEAARAERINAFLQDMLSSADPGGMGKDVTVREVLDQAAARLERGLEADPEARADAHHTLGETYVSLGLLQEGRSHLEKALALRRELSGPDHQSIAQELRSLSDCLRRSGMYTEARRMALEGLRMQRRLMEEPDVLIARLLGELGSAELELGAYEDAETLTAAAVRQLEAMGPTEDGELATALQLLATVYWKREKLVEGEEVTRRALEIRERLSGPDHPSTLDALNTLSLLLEKQGPAGLDEAEALHRELLVRARRSLGDDHTELAAYHNNLAVFLMIYRMRLPEAREHQLEALRIWQQLFDGRHSYIATCFNNLGWIEFNLGNLAAAADWYGKAIEMGETIEAHAIVLRATNNLGTVRHHQGSYSEAMELTDLWLEELRQRNPSSSVERYWTRRQRACVLIHLDRLVEAEAWLAQAGEDLRDLTRSGLDLPALEKSQSQLLGLLRGKEGRWEEARPLLEHAIEDMRVDTKAFAARRHMYRTGEEICRAGGQTDLADAYAEGLLAMEAQLREQVSPARSDPSAP